MNRTVRITINNSLWREFRLEALRIRKPASVILGLLVERWLAHQRSKAEKGNTDGK